MMKHKRNYDDLIDKTREEVKKEMGDGFNYYQNEIWTYNLKKDWLGRWQIIYLHFQDNKVSRVRIGR